MDRQSDSQLTSSPTLDQLRLFVCVVEQGSFSGAGRYLRRAQSAVSYGVANLERQLAVELFDRTGRRPVLTPTGRSLLRDARQVLARVGQLQHRAASVSAGLESDLSIAFDAIFPAGLLAEVCRAFQAEFPTVSLRLHSEVLEGVATLVRDGTCHIGIATPVGTAIGGLRWRFLTHIALLPVVAADHALAALSAPIPTPSVVDHVQIVISQRARASEGTDHSVLSALTWRVADAATKLELIRAGLGWGNLPEDLVRGDVSTGRLVRLVLEAWGDSPLMAPLSAIVREDESLGPAGRWLLDTLVTIGARYSALTSSRP